MLAPGQSTPVILCTQEHERRTGTYRKDQPGSRAGRSELRIIGRASPSSLFRNHAVEGMIDALSRALPITKCQTHIPVAISNYGLFPVNSEAVYRKDAVNSRLQRP